MNENAPCEHSSLQNPYRCERCIAVDKARVEERGFCADIIEAEAEDATAQMAQLLRRIAMMLRRGK